MSDESIAARIERLVTEEHQLRKREADEEPEAVEADATRLREIEIELDVCWDLLRQRRALRDAGSNPDSAEARDPNTVERYWQ